MNFFIFLLYTVRGIIITLCGTAIFIFFFHCFMLYSQPSQSVSLPLSLLYSFSFISACYSQPLSVSFSFLFSLLFSSSSLSLFLLISICMLSFYSPSFSLVIFSFLCLLYHLYFYCCFFSVYVYKLCILNMFAWVAYGHGMVGQAYYADKTLDSQQNMLLEMSLLLSLPSSSLTAKFM